MKRLLIFLVVFCGQVHAASDAEMLPRVMGELKKNLDSSKNWGDFLIKSNAISNTDMMILSKNIGLNKPLPNYRISSNFRTLTAGYHTLEVVNLSTGDFKIDGKAFRYQEGESIYETIYKVKNKRAVSYLSIFSSVAEAQAESKDVCEANSRLINQVMMQEGLKKELSNSALNLISASGSALYYNYKMGGDSKEQTQVRCKDIEESLRVVQNENQIKLIDVDCDGNFRTTDRQLTFAVPATKSVQANKTNKYSMSYPAGLHDNKALEEGNTGRLSGYKKMKVFINWNAREIADADLKKTYTYGDDGSVLKTVSYEKAEGASYTTLKCVKGADVSFEKQYHLNRAIPVLRLFAQKGICYSGCYKGIKAMANANKVEYDKNIKDGTFNDFGDVVELEESDRCKTINDNIEKVSCYVAPRPPCARRANQKVAYCKKGRSNVTPVSGSSATIK